MQYYADSDGDLESSDESLLDQCSPQALAQAQEKVEELQRLLGIAKTHYQQLGGELVEDSESRQLEMEHKKLAHFFLFFFFSSLVVMVDMMEPLVYIGIVWDSSYCTHSMLALYSDIHNPSLRLMLCHLIMSVLVAYTALCSHLYSLLSIPGNSLVWRHSCSMRGRGGRYWKQSWISSGSSCRKPPANYSTTRPCLRNRYVRVPNTRPGFLLVLYKYCILIGSLKITGRHMILKAAVDEALFSWGVIQEAIGYSPHHLYAGRRLYTCITPFKGAGPAWVWTNSNNGIYAG